VREPPDLHELVGPDVPAEELERLRRVDALRRRVPAPPPEIPQTLTARVAGFATERRRWTRPRLAAGLAFAAAAAALVFALGRWTAGDDGFDTRLTVAMQPTEHAPGASALIEVGERDEQSGNWELELDVSGLPELPADDYYVLWLAKDGEYAGTCGTFSVGSGETSVRMTVSYRLGEYDAWVVTAHDEDDDDPPWLLHARI
jgi:hypothetical protein